MCADEKMKPGRPSLVSVQCGCELEIRWNVPSHGRPIGCSITRINPCDDHVILETRKTKSYEDMCKDVYELLMWEFVETREHWVCRGCIGHDDFEEFTVGLIGSQTCEICFCRATRPKIACVSHGVYVEACKRRVR